MVCRIQLGQPATVKVSANLIRMLAYNNKVQAFVFFLFKAAVCLAVLLAILTQNKNSGGDVPFPPVSLLLEQKMVYTDHFYFKGVTLGNVDSACLHFIGL